MSPVGELSAPHSEDAQVPGRAAWPGRRGIVASVFWNTPARV